MGRLWALEGTRGTEAITGTRRSGKSEPIKAFSASVALKNPSASYVYIDLLDLGTIEHPKSTREPSRETRRYVLGGKCSTASQDRGLAQFDNRLARNGVRVAHVHP